MPDDLQQNFAALNQKIDMLIQQNQERHNQIDKRVDKHENRLDAIDERINNLHSNSMEHVHEIISDMEHRILDKIEANSKFSRSNWLIVGIATISSLLSLGTMIVMIVALFR